ncbi:MAG: TIGR00296 family protein [Candidatus Bathyarchaeia archaeon]|jgi:uncharacterized protein (TIGR00296 family)
MAAPFSIDDGRFLVNLVRTAIGEYLSRRREIDPPADTPKHLLDKSGVFVTLNSTKPAHQLRGCIGYPFPTDPLAVATIRSAIEAATGDPRFDPVELAEFRERVVVELSVLTVPDELTAREPVERAKEIKIGQDGLIVGRGARRGLLLPQVAPEWNWDAEEFLSNCCLKAGLQPDAWLDKGTRVEKFQAIIFEETEPSGEVHLKEL